MRSARPFAIWLTGWSRYCSEWFFSFGRGGRAPETLAFARCLSFGAMARLRVAASFLTHRPFLRSIKPRSHKV
jgi:hypothetical protein